MRAFRQRTIALLLAPLLLASGQAQASTANHVRFDALLGSFASGEEVTRACLSCYGKAAKQIMATRHWTWDYMNPDTGQRLGKKTMLNGFCIGDRSNEAFCQSCHIGYGWKDASFDFTDETKVDCLSCHNTGNYLKLAGLAGHPPLVRSETAPGSGKFVEPVDLAAVARHVGATTRRTCGTCHYYGGGGDGVKHGDLDSSLNAPSRELDVHMAAEGLDFTCSTCHVAEEHRIAGSRINVTASDQSLEVSAASATVRPVSPAMATSRTRETCCTPGALMTTPACLPARAVISRPSPAAACLPNGLGLVQRRKNGRQRQAIPDAQRARSGSLRQQKGQFRTQRGCSARLCLVRRSG